MAEPVFPILVEIPAIAATDFNLAPVINPNNESRVDVRAGTDAAVLLVAWLNPGRDVGDELIVRFIKRTGNISGGVDAGNRASIRLKVLNPQTRRQDLAYDGFGRTDPQYDLPAYPSTPGGESPVTLVIFRWSGRSWLPVFADLP